MTVELKFLQSGGANEGIKERQFREDHMRHFRKSIGITAVAAAFVLLAPSSVARAANSAYDQASQLEIDAMDLQAKGDLDNALVKYRQAVQIYPKSKAYKENLANALNAAGVNKYQAKDYAGAIALFNEALDNVPNFQRAKDNLAIAQGDQGSAQGMAQFKAGDYAGAAATFDLVVKAQPNNKGALANRDAAQAELAIKAGDFATAVAKLQEALAAAPGNTFLTQRLQEAQAALADAQAKAEKEKQKSGS